MQVAVASDITLTCTPLTCLLWKLLHHVLTLSLLIRHQSVTSPLCQSGHLIYSHPDQAFAVFIRRGLSSGFRIGFISSHNLRPHPATFQSVNRNSQIVDQYISEEVARFLLFHCQSTHYVAMWLFWLIKA